jgi:hypothetical protein
MEEHHLHTAVQIWPSGKAPADLCRKLDRNVTFDWVAYVPKCLNDPGIVALLTGSATDPQYIQRVDLADGSLLLAGPSADLAEAVAHPQVPYSGQRARGAAR